MLLRIILSIWLSCVGSLLQAQVLQLNASTHTVELTGHLWASAPQANIDGPGKALALYRNGQFQKLPGNLGRGYRTEDVWLAFELNTSGDSPEYMVVEVGPAFLDHVSVWQVNAADELTSLGSAGDHVAQSKILLPALKPSFALRLRRTASTTVLLQIQTASTQAAIVKLYRATDFPAVQAAQGLLLGSIFTAGLVMVILALGLYGVLRDPLYLLWLVYVVVTAGQWFMVDGLAYHYVDFADMRLITHLTNAFGVLSMSVGTVFVAIVFKFKTLHRWLHNLFLGWGALSIAIGILGSLPGFQLFMGLLIYLSFPFFLIAFIAIFLQIIRRQRESLWLGPLFLLYLAAAGINLLAALGIWPYSDAAFYGWQVAGFLNLLSLQVAMFVRTRQSQRRHLQERLALLEKLTDQNLELEEQVATRTHSLSQALRDLQHAESEQRQLLSMASHEFRTPAAMIKASLDSLALLKDRIPPEIDSRLVNMRQASVRLAELTNSLINQDRLQELSLKPRLATMDLRQLVQVVTSRYAQPKPLLIALPEEALFIRGDAALLSIAIHNLIDNALRHGKSDRSDEQYVTVALQVLKNELELRVADNGPGIPDHEKEKVFERFHTIGRRRRAADGATTSQLGSGLGLSIVKSIASAHDGHVCVRDQQPHGAVLVMRLPLPLVAGSVAI
jgi:signal transduction histidine kinase